jgi:hypothetical protein
MIGAQAIVRASSLIPIKVVDWHPFVWRANEKPHAGWVERLS